MRVTVPARHFRRCFNANVALLRNLIDQILRHAQGKTSPTHQHDHFSRIVRKKYRRLASGVPSPNHEYLFPGDTGGLLARGAIEYSTAKEAVQPGNFDSMPIDSSRQQNCACPYAISAIQLHPITHIGGENRFDAASDGNLRAEPMRLLD